LGVGWVGVVRVERVAVGGRTVRWRGRVGRRIGNSSPRRRRTACRRRVRCRIVGLGRRSSNFGMSPYWQHSEPSIVRTRNNLAVAVAVVVAAVVGVVAAVVVRVVAVAVVVRVVVVVAAVVGVVGG
jgi:hypothetical protein